MEIIFILELLYLLGGCIYMFTTNVSNEQDENLSLMDELAVRFITIVAWPAILYLHRDRE